MNAPLKLSSTECRNRLLGERVGRVAVCTPQGPHIVPVNYALDGESVVFRTTPFTLVGTFGWDTELAFEVDQVDHEGRRGWSVMAFGRGSLVGDAEELEAIQEGWDPDPWPGGDRMLYIRLRWTSLTGREIPGVPASAPA